MKKIRKQIVSGLLGTTLVLNMPVASALTQKNITVGRGVTIYVDDQKIKPGDPEAYFVCRTETLVNGSWLETWGFWAYEKRQNMMRVELAKD